MESNDELHCSLFILMNMIKFYQIHLIQDRFDIVTHLSNSLSIKMNIFIKPDPNHSAETTILNKKKAAKFGVTDQPWFFVRVFFSVFHWVFIKKRELNIEINWNEVIFPLYFAGIGPGSSFKLFECKYFGLDENYLLETDWKLFTFS